MGLTRPQHHQIITDMVYFDDPIIEVNHALTGANATDIGFVFNRGTSGDNIALIWDYINQEFMLVSTTSNGSTNGSIINGGYLNLHVGELSTENLAFPTADGTAGQLMTTDGAGNLSFTDLDWGDINGTLGDQTDLNNELTAIKGNVSTNAGDISTLQGAVVTNTGNIGTNAGDILINAGLISDNADAIGLIQTDVTTNAGLISDNADAIGLVETDVTTNAGLISTNTGNIGNNSSDITTIQLNGLTNTSEVYGGTF